MAVTESALVRHFGRTFVQPGSDDDLDGVTNGALIDETVTPVEALVELARSSREEPVDVVLRTVAETVQRIAGFRSVVVNVFRPAWDDYVVEAVIDTPEGCAALDGTVNPSATFDRLITFGTEEPPGVFFVSDTRFWDEIEHFWTTPNATSTDDPLAWNPISDGVFIVLRDANGVTLGNLSIDEPIDGLRPGTDTLRLLRAIGSHAEHALESAHRNATAAEMARIQALVLAATSRLTACTTPHELLTVACETIAPGLGFERVAVYRGCEQSGMLELSVTTGWDTRASLAPRLTIADAERLLDAGGEQFGSWLLPAEALVGAIGAPGDERSRRNGRGPLAWNEHCLVVPMRTPEGAISDLIVVEDPTDHLLPSNPRRRAIRLLVDQVSAVQTSIETHDRLSYLATHDPLTGVHNRRNLTELLEHYDDVALLICDLDEFKQINDRYGHDVGDRVLIHFGELLRELARDSDVALRLGGEEFGLLLPHTDTPGALATAERLRVETARRMLDIVPGGVTVSVGVAASSRGLLDARGLLSAADRGLYAAKAAGRDRVKRGH